MSLSDSKSLSIILPAAGFAQRMGTPEAKELIEVCTGTRLIDFSLNHIRLAQKLKIPHKVIVVIRKEKESVYEHVYKTLSPASQVLCEYFNPNFQEWPGSIFSAKRHFSNYNLVLLPDSVIRLSANDPMTNENGSNLVEQVIQNLTRSPLVLGVCRCSDPSILSTMGSVKIGDDGNVLDLKDKPRKPESFNGFWGALAFNKSIASELHEFLHQSVVEKTGNFPAQSFCPAASFPIHHYTDLGTPESLANFQ